MYFIFYVLMFGFMSYGEQKKDDLSLERQQRMEKFNSYFQEVTACDESAQRIINNILSIQNQIPSIEEVCRIEDISTLDKFEKCIEHKSQWVLDIDQLIKASNHLKKSCPAMSVSTKKLEDFQFNLKHRYNYIKNMYNDALQKVENKQAFYQNYKPHLCQNELGILIFNIAMCKISLGDSNADITDLYELRREYNKAQIRYDKLVEVGKACQMEHVEPVLEGHELMGAINGHLQRINNIDFLDSAGKTCNFLEENNIDTLSICEDPKDNAHWRYTLHLLSRQYYAEKRRKRLERLRRKKLDRLKRLNR